MFYLMCTHCLSLPQRILWCDGVVCWCCFSGNGCAGSPVPWDALGRTAHRSVSVIMEEAVLRPLDSVCVAQDTQERGHTHSQHLTAWETVNGGCNFLNSWQVLNNSTIRWTHRRTFCPLQSYVHSCQQWNMVLPWFTSDSCTMFKHP